MERRKHDSTMKRMMRDLKEGAADALDMISSYRFRESVEYWVQKCYRYRCRKNRSATTH